MNPQSNIDCEPEVNIEKHLTGNLIYGSFKEMQSLILEILNQEVITTMVCLMWAYIPNMQPSNVSQYTYTRVHAVITPPSQ